MKENSTHRAKFSLQSDEPDQKAAKHRDLCPERCQDQEAVTEVDWLVEEGALGKMLYAFSM